MVETNRLQLVPQSVDDVRAMLDSLPPEDRAQVSDDWLARVTDPGADEWTLGFRLLERDTGTLIGHAGFKGPPSDDGCVEIAYGILPEHQGRGYGTEAAGGLLAFIRNSGRVRTVRAHTLPERNASCRILEKHAFELIGEVLDPEDGRVWRWEKRLANSEDDSRSEGTIPFSAAEHTT